MARIRTIKPEFPQSESMGNVGRDARLTFLQLWTIADDEGRLRGNSRMLASLLFPYDDDASSLIDGWLAELETEKCIARYKVDGQSYIQICNWLIHQKIDKPSKSKIPAFEKAREDSRSLVAGRDQGPKDQGSEDQGVDQGKDQGRELIVGQKQPNLSADPVSEVFDYWKKVMKSPKSVLDDKRKALIREALQNYERADLCKAIRGCSKTPFNMGKNKENRKYNGLSLILRDAEHIDKFIALDADPARAAAETMDEINARAAAEFLGEEMVDDDMIIEMEA